MVVTLAPLPLPDWAATDMEWWQELAAAKTAWLQGRDAGAASKASWDAFYKRTG